MSEMEFNQIRPKDFSHVLWYREKFYKSDSRNKFFMP
jgi:hypothetical protein